MAFVENLPAIRSGLSEGRTAKAVYLRHADTLAGRVSYPQFVRYVRRLLRVEAIAPLRHSAAHDPVRSARGAPAAPAPASPTAPPRPAATRPAVADGGSDARHEHPRARTVSRTFSYDGNPSAGDEDLIRPSGRAP